MQSTTPRYSNVSHTPPSQVFTRGTVGAVKTTMSLSQQQQQQRPSRSHQSRHQHPPPPPHTPTVRSHSAGASSRRNSNSNTSSASKGRRPFPSSLPRVRRSSPLSSSSNLSSTAASTISSSSQQPQQQLQPQQHVSPPRSDTTSPSEIDSVHSAPPVREVRDNASSTRKGGLVSNNIIASENKLYSKTARRVLDDLSRAHGLDHRKVCLTNVCTSFDHNEEAMHNVELLLGAMSILTKCLGTAHDDDEIRMVCAALEMVTRGSTRNVTMALIAASDGTINASSNNNKNHQQQHTLLFHYLLKVLERCENGLLKHADISILNTTKILKNVSRSFELRPTLARQEGLLDMLCRIQLSSIKQEQQPAAAATTTTNAPATATSTSSLSHDCRLQRMQLMATLACCDDNKRLMFEKKGLIECVVRVAHVDPSEDIRRQAALILMELASATCNQVAMANDDKVLGLLVKMVLIEKGPIVREAVITALQNLAFAKENRVRLVSFKSGVLLEALKQALSSDLDAKARRRAAGALTNLVCVETAQQMGEHKGLLHTLAIVSTKDENVDVQTRATLALTKIGNLLASHTACHEALMDALVVASLSKASNNVSAVLRVKARDPGNRESMARHPGVVDTLCDLCLSDGSSTADKDSAVRAIMHLCNEANNRKILCSSAVLDALIKGANYTDPELDEARDSAIRALERLGTEPCNRLLMSRRRGLLTAVAKAVEREADWEASGMESEHGYLAKPLLMSLLVSM